MNVVKIIRPATQPVKLIRATPGRAGSSVRLVRVVAPPVRLENTKGVAYLGEAGDAARINLNTDLSSYYNLRKQC